MKRCPTISMMSPSQIEMLKRDISKGIYIKSLSTKYGIDAKSIKRFGIKAGLLDSAGNRIIEEKDKEIDSPTVEELARFIDENALGPVVLDAIYRNNGQLAEAAEILGYDINTLREFVNSPKYIKMNEAYLIRKIG